MIDEAKKIITTIRQMEASIDDSKSNRNHHDDEEFKITYPLNRCLQNLKEKHTHISRLHKERFEQVKSEFALDNPKRSLLTASELVQALESYSSHLEPTFVQIPLPPTGPNQPVSPTFDLSPSYVDRLDAEFTRVYDEYTRRIASVQSLADNIINLWAELGVPQAQQDGAIVKYYREAPEQLGLHEDDVKRLQTKRDRLSDEKKNREKKLNALRSEVEALWEKLGIEESETKSFANSNRGCGVRQINEYEAELTRLNELKRENLHLFVEDSRVQLQGLWDALYFSEDEMLEFTPAFSDVYSDALLEAHEREIARLEALKEQRAPTLALVDKHKSLVKERNDLNSSSQDASRLMLRGQKGEKRDPGKLLREEKMRKRIAKELPKVAVEVRKMLEKWEDEYGRPFLVYGERYLDELDAEESKRAGNVTRAKTPAGAPPSAVKPAPKSAQKPTSSRNIPSRNMTKTPTAGRTPGRTPAAKKTGVPTPAAAKESPSKLPTSPSRIPARAPLSNLKNGNNSPQRRPESRGDTLRNGAPARAPPPKMRELRSVGLETPVNPYKSANLGSAVVKAIDPEDVYDDHQSQYSRTTRSHSGRSYQTQSSSFDGDDGYDDGYDDEDRYGTIRGKPSYPMAPPPRQTSATSTVVSGSENWETYDDYSEPEPDASEAYYAKLKAARGKRQEPEYGHGPSATQAKRMRGIPPPQGYTGPVMIDNDGNRIVSGGDWTDEDVF